MLYQVVPQTVSLLNFQRCILPSNIPPDHNGKCAFFTTSDGNTYFGRICMETIFPPELCFLDYSSQILPEKRVSSPQMLPYDQVKIVPSVNYIKNAHIEIVFNTIWDVQKWKEKNEMFEDIVKQILELFVLTNNLKLELFSLNDINKVNIHTIIIKSIGNVIAGKIVETSKVFIDKLTCYARFLKCQEGLLKDVHGLRRPYSILKELIASVHNTCLHPSTLQINSSMKILITGPTGCGKKSLIQRISSEYKAVIVTIDGPELIRSSPGETEQLMKEKFDEALLSCTEGLTILLILRIETVCNKEGRILIQFLHLLDSIPPSSLLIVIGTTSKPNLLHPHIRSSARFPNRIVINIPTEEERCEMITGLCGSTLSKKSILTVAQKTPGFVLGDINLLVTRAKRKVLLNSSLNISEEALLSALNECIYQIEPSSTRGELGIVKIDKLDIKELGGLESVKNVLLQTIQWPLLHPEAFRRLGINKPSGVLLYGPPGCAKTSLIRAIAASTNITFLSISAADLFSPYVGDAEITLTDLFQRARDAAPAILFIDEIDALVGYREEKHRGAQERILSTFLVEMDGIGVKAESIGLEKVETKVTVVAATNRPDSVDPALLRPGRLDRLVYVPPPSLQDRLDILKLLTKRVPLSSCVDLNYIAEKTVLYSGADLKSLCQEAGLNALTSDGMHADVVKQEHWLHAMKEIRPSLDKDQVDWYHNFSFS